ncbi:hypothetical protein KIPB_003672 [Kipferlia bialata]|uniref:Phosphoribosyltransferase domain-containing protein n=1 Tax=Kipferlia bialata TaxID=797122 RepID=A0A9K3CSR4_9EUKA|nr:hypothetical protein KIPB_003672 [Kipferlia bialata]|eukprot:g3672.t1
MQPDHSSLHQIPTLTDRTGVFADRRDAGATLVDMLTHYRNTNTLVLGIPNGGMPVAAEVAKGLGLHMDVAICSKMLLPWTTEAGFGAVAWDGSEYVNTVYAEGLTKQQVEEARYCARGKVSRRDTLYRQGAPFPSVTGATVLLVDDGIASGVTIRASVSALRKHQPASIVVVVPTGHLSSVLEILSEVDAVYCANVRGGRCYAVADAYLDWCDVSDTEVMQDLTALRRVE